MLKSITLTIFIAGLFILTSSVEAQVLGKIETITNQNVSHSRPEFVEQIMDEIGNEGQSNQIKIELNNNLEALTKKLIPTIMREENLDEVEIPLTLLEEAEAPWWITDTVKRCYKGETYKVRLKDGLMELDFDDDTIELDIKDDGVVEATIDMPDFEFTGGIKFKWNPIPENKASWYCNNVAKPNGIEYYIPFTGTGLNASVELTFTTEDRKLVVSKVKNFSVELDKVSIDITLLDVIINTVISIANIPEFFGLGGNVCNNTTDCVNSLLKNQVSDNKSIKDNIEKGITDAMATTLEFTGDDTVNGKSFIYDVFLDNIETNDSKNQLIGKLSASVTTPNIENSCAKNLKVPTFYGISSATSEEDIAVKIPFVFIGETIRSVISTSDICDPVTVELTEVYGPTGNLLFGGPTTTILSLDGIIDIYEGASPNFIKIKLPFEVTTESGTIFNGSGDMVVVTKLSTNCTSGLQLDVVRVDIENLSLSATNNGITLPITGTALATIDTNLENTLTARVPGPFPLASSFGGTSTYGYHLNLESANADNKNIYAKFDLQYGLDTSCQSKDLDDEDIGIDPGPKRDPKLDQQLFLEGQQKLLQKKNPNGGPAGTVQKGSTESAVDTGAPSVQEKIGL